MNDPKLITIEAWISKPPKRPYYEDKHKKNKRIAFGVKVPLDLQPFLSKPRTTIYCQYRIRHGFKYSLLGEGATIKLTGYVEKGPKGGESFHCKNVEILIAIPRAKPDKATVRMVKKMEEKAGIVAPSLPAKKKKPKRSTEVPPQPTGTPLRLFD